jgi:hypothetical protein
MNFRSILLIAALALSTSTFAQDSTAMRTLLGGGRQLHHGGWGALSTHHTRIMDQDALLTGVRGGWIINHRVTIGIAGQGLTTTVKNPAFDAAALQRGDQLSRTSRFHMGYGGLLIEPVIAFRSPIHVSLPLIIGAGGAGYQTFHTPQLLDEAPEHFHHSDAQAFFVVEPGIELELNVIPLVRVGIGASYRYTSAIDLPGTPTDALHGLNAGVTLKIGKF